MNFFSPAVERNLLEAAHRDSIDRLVVGALIFHPDDNDKFLVLERASTDFMGGIEELPSGKVEENESLVAALAREVEEETGLIVTSVQNFLWSFDYRSRGGSLTRQFNFVVEVAGNSIRLCENEHSGFRWLSKAQIEESRLTPNVVDVLKSYSRNSESSFTHKRK